MIPEERMEDQGVKTDITFIAEVGNCERGLLGESVLTVRWITRRGHSSSRVFQLLLGQGLSRRLFTVCTKHDSGGCRQPSKIVSGRRLI